MLDIPEIDSVSQSPFGSPFNIKIKSFNSSFAIKGGRASMLLFYLSRSYFRSGLVLLLLSCNGIENLPFKGGFRGVWNNFQFVFWVLPDFLFLIFYFLFIWIFWDIWYLQSPFYSLPKNRERLFNIEMSISINVLQLKGDALRSCLSSNQLTSFVQGSSPFATKLILKYFFFQRGIQGDSVHNIICQLISRKVISIPLKFPPEKPGQAL
jgi:hypothetical protein